MRNVKVQFSFYFSTIKKEEKSRFSYKSLTFYTYDVIFALLSAQVTFVQLINNCLRAAQANKIDF